MTSTNQEVLSSFHFKDDTHKSRCAFSHGPLRIRSCLKFKGKRSWVLGLADLRFSGYEPKLVSPSAMIRRLRDTLNGPGENESHSGRPEESMDEPNSDPLDLQIIGQEMVSVSGNGKGKGNGHGGSSATSAELVPATPTRPTTRPTMLATRRSRRLRIEG